MEAGSGAGVPSPITANSAKHTLVLIGPSPGSGYRFRRIPSSFRSTAMESLSLLRILTTLLKGS